MTAPHDSAPHPGQRIWVVEEDGYWRPLGYTSRMDPQSIRWLIREHPDAQYVAIELRPEPPDIRWPG